LTRPQKHHIWAPTCGVSAHPSVTTAPVLSCPLRCIWCLSPFLLRHPPFPPSSRPLFSKSNCAQGIVPLNQAPALFMPGIEQGRTHSSRAEQELCSPYCAADDISTRVSTSSVKQIFFIKNTTAQHRIESLHTLTHVCVNSYSNIYFRSFVRSQTFYF